MIGRAEVRRPFVVAVGPVVAYPLAAVADALQSSHQQATEHGRGKAEPVDTTSRQEQEGMGRPAESAPAPADRRRWWRVDCRDVTGSRRFLTVLVNRDRVVLVGPPGNSSALTRTGTVRVSTALRDAASQARK
ncbi:hypothetical protein GCM10023222_17420 [Saccharopolyspora cebuensis]